jgi:transcriptional regulator with XRE-family HTH domain
MDRVYLREWRRYRALSQADLARQAGVTEATISRLEQANAPLPRPSTIRKLAAILAVAPHELYAPPTTRPHEESR